MSDLYENTIDCDTHGRQHEAFVCQHIANSSITRRAVGFHWSSGGDSYWPDAWCSECNDRLIRSAGEWVGDAEDRLGAKLLCAACYEVAAELNFVTDRWREGFEWSRGE